MSQGIVDVLEAVQIQEQHCDLLLMALRSGNRLADPIVQEHPIGQTGQEIVLGRMGYLQRHGAGRAHVAENDDGSRDLPFAVMDGRDAVLDRHFMSVAADQDAVRRQVHGPVLIDCHLHRIGSGFASCGVQDLKNVDHRPAGRILQRPARQFFRNQIKEGDVSCDVGANNGVADTIERNLCALLFHEQRLFHSLALDGIAQGSQKSARFDLAHARCYLALDEIVLRALLQGLRGQHLVVQPRQHHQRDAGRGCVRPPHRFQSLRIGQPEVEQDDINRMLRKMLLGVAMLSACNSSELYEPSS